MASDSQTTTPTTSEKPLENKEAAKLMEKEIVLSETVDVVEDKPVSDSNLTVAKEEQVDQTVSGEPEKVSAAVVEEVAAIVKAENEQVEIKESTILVKEVVEEVNVGSIDGEKVEEKGKEQVELTEPTTFVKEGVEEIKLETVDAEKTEEKQTVEGVVEEDNKDKEEKKVVDVSESSDEAIRNQVEPADVEIAENKVGDVEVLEVKPKPETSEKVETQSEKVKELAPEVEVVKAEETQTPDKTEQSKETEGDTSSPADVIEKAITEEANVVDAELTNQDSKTNPASPGDVVEKSIAEEKHVMEEPSKDEQENMSEEAKDVVTKPIQEDENIKKDTEPAAEGKKEETLKEAEANKQEESITDKGSEVEETTSEVKESDEPKQQPEVTTKEEVATKQKHSNSIMSKVKQSFVKAKKAIIGKSPSSKTISTEEAKGEIKVK